MNELHLEHYGDVIICPYDKTHVIPAHRLQRHLVKCQKQHPNAKLAICIFNATHHVPEEELKDHQKNCPDRAIIELDKYIVSDCVPKGIGLELEAEIKLANQSRKPYDGPPASAVENWDDMNAPPYNPEEYCLNTTVIRKAENMTRSERRKFRAEDIVRLRKLEGN